MFKPHLIFRNLVALGTGELIDRLLAMLLMIYLARVLGAVAFGMIGIGISLIRFAGALISSGSLNFGVRALARNPDSVPVVYPLVTGFRLSASLVIVLLGMVALPWSTALLGIEADLLFVYLLSLPIQAFVLSWLFRGLEKMHLAAGSLITQQALMLAVTVALVHGAGDILRVPIIEIAAMALVIMWGQYWVRKRYGPLGLELKPAELREVAKESLGIGVSNLFRMVHAQGDVLLLGILATSTALAGEFLASQKIVLTLSGFTFLLISAALPALARLVHADREGAAKLQNQLIRINLMVFMPAVLLGVFYADPIVALLYGDEYRQSAMVMRLMLWTIPLAIFLASLRQTLMAAAAIRAVMLVSAFGATVHITLGILLIPRLGLQGAVLSNIIAVSLSVIVLLVVVQRLLGRSILSLRMLGPLLATGAAYMALDAGSTLPWFLQAGLGLLVYLGVALAAGSVSRNELKSLMAMFSRITTAEPRDG